MQQAQCLFFPWQLDRMRQVAQVDDDILHKIQGVPVRPEEHFFGAQVPDNIRQEADDLRYAKNIEVGLVEGEISDQSRYTDQAVDRPVEIVIQTAEFWNVL
jgi:hypothetical protein